MRATLKHHLEDTNASLVRARQFLAANRRDEACASYLEALNHDPLHPATLHELGCLAYADGFRSAARNIYMQIVRCWPQDLVGRVNLGNILYEDGDLSAAQKHFMAVIAVDPDSAEAHRGMGRILSDRGDVEAADRHWCRSFPEQAITTQPYRGKGCPTPILLLVSAKGGNIPTRHILDDRTFAVSVLYVEYYKPHLPLPPHALVFNAIGDADLCPAALAAAEEIVARTKAPTLNKPSKVRRSGRAANAARLAIITGVRSPWIYVLPRATIADEKRLTYPLLLRSQGFHTGQHFVRVECREKIEGAAAGLPGENLLAIQYLNARGRDGMVRKYRAMFIGNVLYPMHLAISANWKVHYFTADMATNAAYRAEEQRFLEAMPDVLGAPAMAALMRIVEMLGLDYGGIDFAVCNGGTIIPFEANATMVINPPPSGRIWDYRRAPVERALNAIKDLLIAKSQQ